MFNHLETPWNLQRSERAHVVVVVTDGVRWSAAASAEFELRHPTIWPVILSPKDGDSYRSDDTIVLSGVADGALAGNWQELPAHMLRWHSNLDGAFPIDPPDPTDEAAATGRIAPGTLTPGVHHITLTATDVTGNTGSDTVTIEVRP